MSFLTPAKKSLIAVALVAPLSLAACGSDDENAGDTASSAAKTTTTTQPKEKTSEKKTEEKTSEEKKEGEGEENKGDAAKPEGENPEDANQAMANPFEEGADPFQNIPKVEPVQGEAASQEDIDGINGLVRGMYEQQTMRAFVKYLPEHTCAAIRNDPNSGLDQVDYNQVPDVPMNQLKDMMAAAGQDTSQMDGFDWSKTGVESINDVVVNGEHASATVNVNTSQGMDSSTMRFKRENGNWTFCG